MVQLSTFIGTLALAISAANAAPDLSRRAVLPDPAGEKNVGNGAGVQFIGGQCLGAADCASGCCATLPQGGQTIGVCSGVGAQTQAGKQGCGFESAGAGTGTGTGNVDNGNNLNNGGNTDNSGNFNNGSDTGTGNTGNTDNSGNTGNTGSAGGTVVPSTLTVDPAGEKNVGNGAGGQFIGGECTGDVDCASGCCALVNTGASTFGICSGLGANTQNGKQGCGFPAGGQQLAGSA